MPSLTAILIGAGIGAGTSAATGGDVGKGAIFGAAGGAIGGHFAGSAAGGMTAREGAIMGGLAGGGIGGTMFRKTGEMKMPGQPMIEPLEPTSVEEIEAQEAGWAEITKRARGRRATILTESMLAQISPYTQRATLLSG